MPNWKKVIISGSNAALNDITASGAVTIQNGLTVTGSALITGNLEVTGSIKSTDSVWVGEDGAFKSSQPSTAGPTSGSYFDQSLQFFIPYRSDGTTIAENRSGLKLGGQLFFEPRTTNGTILYGFSTIAFKRTDGTGTGIGLSMGNTGTYPENSVTLSSWASFKNTSDRYFQVYGYFGHKFTINGGEVMRVNSTGLGLNTTSPSAKLHVIGANDLSSNYALKVQNSSGTDILAVENDGKVGINVSDPSETLDVNGKIKIGAVNNASVITSDGAGGMDIANRAKWFKGNATLATRGSTWVLAGHNNNADPNSYTQGFFSIDKNASSRSILSLNYNTSTTTLIDVNALGNLVIIPNDNVILSSSLTVSQSVSASTYYGDGSNLTGIDSGSWDGIFTGSAEITGSLEINNTLFTTISSSVSTGTTTLYTFTNYEATHAEYKVKNGSNLRTGTVVGCWDGSNIDYTETSINGLGDTSDVSFAFTSTGQLQITTSGTYEVKVTARAL